MFSHVQIKAVFSCQQLFSFTLYLSFLLYRGHNDTHFDSVDVYFSMDAFVNFELRDTTIWQDRYIASYMASMTTQLKITPDHKVKEGQTLTKNDTEYTLILLLQYLTNTA